MCGDHDMNIFVLDYNPKLAAQYHCDKHVGKMLIESVQLLSGCMPKRKAPYKHAYLHHPCSKWAQDSLINTKWLMELAKELDAQFIARYGKQHKSGTALKQVTDYFSNAVNNISEQPQSFVAVVPDEYKKSCVVESYRNYYIQSKSRFAKWEKGVGQPNWYTYDSLSRPLLSEAQIKSLHEEGNKLHVEIERRVKSMKLTPEDLHRRID